MKIPQSFTVRSRRLSNLAEYVPAYDGRVISSARFDDDGLVDAAETAHRIIAISTNIGNILFEIESLSTFCMDLIRLKWSKAILRNLRSRVSEFYWLADEIASSSQTLDESFSAIIGHLAILESVNYGVDNGLNYSDFQRLEQSLRSYGIPVLRTYQRITSLAKKFIGEEIDNVWRLLEVLIDAAQINPRDRYSLYSCDARVQVFLKIAEVAARRGISVDDLPNYLIESGGKAGYRVTPLIKMTPQDSASAIYTVTDSYLAEPSQIQAIQELRSVYTNINEARYADVRSWSEFVDDLANLRSRSKISMFLFHTRKSDKEKITDTFKCPSILAFPEGRKISIVLKASHNKLGKAWSKYLFLVLLRNAILRDEKECPLSLIRPKAEKEIPVCSSSQNRDCTYRQLRQVFFSL